MCVLNTKRGRSRLEWVYLLLSFAGGVGLAFQASVNGELGRKIGTVEVACMAYTIGAIFLFSVAYFFGKGNIEAALSFPKWKLFIGLMGAIYIVIMVLSVPKIGVAAAIAATIVGQIFLSTLADHFGFFGNPSIPIGPYRILGIILMLLALYCFYKK